MPCSCASDSELTYQWQDMGTERQPCLAVRATPYRLNSCEILICALGHLYVDSRLSRAGRCFTFNATAEGYVRGEGIAALQLCRGLDLCGASRILHTSTFPRPLRSRALWPKFLQDEASENSKKRSNAPSQRPDMKVS